MNTNTLALPRIRRKRRKPPGPRFWWTLANVLFCAGFAVFDGVRFALYGGAWRLMSAVFMVALLAWWWPEFQRELEAWKRDS